MDLFEPYIKRQVELERVSKQVWGHLESDACEPSWLGPPTRTFRQLPLERFSFMRKMNKYEEDEERQGARR